MSNSLANDDLNERHQLRLQALGGERTTLEQRAAWAAMRVSRQQAYEDSLPIRDESGFGMRKYFLPTLIFLMALGSTVGYFLLHRVG